MNRHSEVNGNIGCWSEEFHTQRMASAHVMIPAILYARSAQRKSGETCITDKVDTRRPVGATTTRPGLLRCAVNAWSCRSPPLCTPPLI